MPVERRNAEENDFFRNGSPPYAVLGIGQFQGGSAAGRNSCQ